MQRTEKAKPKEFAIAVIDEVIGKHGFFSMATTGPDGAPYSVPLSMARDGEWLYFHSAMKGHKTDNLKFSKKVCISCVSDYKMPPGKFSVDYRSAVIFGTAVEITSDDEKTAALRLISKSYTADNMANFDAGIERHLGRTSVWKIHIDETSGKNSTSS